MIVLRSLFHLIVLLLRQHRQVMFKLVLFVVSPLVLLLSFFLLLLLFLFTFLNALLLILVALLLLFYADARFLLRLFADDLPLLVKICLLV